MLDLATTDRLRTLSPSRYRHDCNGCTYRGQLGVYDIYTCGDSVIARCGDGGSEYWSSPISCMTPRYYLTSIGLASAIPEVVVREDLIILLSELEDKGVIQTSIKIGGGHDKS